MAARMIIGVRIQCLSSGCFTMLNLPRNPWFSGTSSHCFWSLPVRLMLKWYQSWTSVVYDESLHLTIIIEPVSPIKPRFTTSNGCCLRMRSNHQSQFEDQYIISEQNIWQIEYGFDIMRRENWTDFCIRVAGIRYRVYPTMLRIQLALNGYIKPIGICLQTVCVGRWFSKTYPKEKQSVCNAHKIIVSKFQWFETTMN